MKRRKYLVLVALALIVALGGCQADAPRPTSPGLEATFAKANQLSINAFPSGDRFYIRELVNVWRVTGNRDDFTGCSVSELNASLDAPRAVGLAQPGEDGASWSTQATQIARRP